MKTTIIQIPINQQLRDKAKKAAEEQGFSSLQEAVRVFLNQFASNDLSVGFTPTINLSKGAADRYAEMIDDVESGKVKTKSFSSAKDLMKHLKA